MRSLFARTLAVALTVVVGAPLAAAHEGHGHPEIQTGLMHQVSSPVHFVPWLAVSGIVVGLILATRRIRGIRAKALADRSRRTGPQR